VAGPQTEHTSLRGSLKGTKALDGLGNVILTKINHSKDLSMKSPRENIKKTSLGRIIELIMTCGVRLPTHNVLGFTGKHKNFRVS